MAIAAAALLVLAGVAFLVHGTVSARSAHRKRVADLLDFELSNDGKASAATVSLYQKVARWTESRTEKSPWSERQTVRLERARIALRPAEFLLLWLGAAGLGALVGLVALGPLGLVAFGALGGVVPPVVVAHRTRSWRRRFEAQLPDVLDLAASSMEAGHSLLESAEEGGAFVFRIRRGAD